MSGDLSNVDLKTEYNTEEDDIVKDLYSPCLARASHYDRAVGYFRANIYRELGEDLLNFVNAGGTARIVCSPDLPLPDEEAAREGYSKRGTRPPPALSADLANVMELMAKNPDEADCLQMLRLLVETKALDLFVAVRPGGIYHRKIGRFTDDSGNFVVFSGSGNETEPAVSTIEDWANDEEFDVFRSWGGEFESQKALRKGAYLDRLFAGGTNHTKVRPLNEVERKVLESFRSYSSLDDCRAGARRRTGQPHSAEEICVWHGPPPYYFQEQAVKRWNDAKRVGLLAMATGTGKTLTALLAVQPLLQSGNIVVVLVPSNVLLNQWHEAVRTTLPSVPILCAGGGNDWHADTSKRMFIEASGKPRVVIATMQTASNVDFIEFIQQAADLVLVADEAHRLGSEKHRKILKVPFVARLGLSATPERLFDPVGSAALAKAFGDPPIYSLPIGGRVKLSPDDPKEVPVLGKFLSRYRYGFETVYLTAEEQEEWNAITKEIVRRIVKTKGKKIDPLGADSRLKLLLIQRAKIVKLAQGKIDVASRAVAERYPEGGRWIIYCEDENQLTKVTARLRKENPSIAILPYHSKMSQQERSQALGYFEKSPSIIVSIRCLDEGVNLPAADGGLILASSSNPREYVQRRGRLLRLAVGKSKADIIDALVLPTGVPGEDDVPVSIAKSELARAHKFALDADNVEITHELWRLCQEYHVNPAKDADIDADPDADGEDT